MISSHFFEVNELPDEHWANILRIEIFSTPIYVECDKIYRSNVCVQEFWYIVSGLENQPEQSETENDNHACKKAVPGCKIRRIMYRFSHIVDMNLWLSCKGEVQWGGRHGFDSRWVLKLSAAPLPFCVALSPSVQWVHWHARFYIAALSILFSWISSVAISRWQAFNPQHEHPSSAVLEHLESGPRARTQPHVRAWRMGVITAIVEPRSKNDKSAWPLIFLELSKIFEHNGLQWKFFNPHPPDWYDMI